MISKLLASAAILIALPVTSVLAQDSMASDSMASDAMTGDSMAMDAMAQMPMSEEDLTLCIEEAEALSFAAVAMAAEQACHALHNGEMMSDDAMMDEALDGDAMAGDSMSGEAMAPGQ